VGGNKEVIERRITGQYPITSKRSLDKSIPHIFCCNKMTHQAGSVRIAPAARMGHFCFFY